MLGKNTQEEKRFYVFTGGPGVGKTTTLQALSRPGLECVPEVAREIIREQMDSKGNALPWKDKKKYRDMMLSRSIDSYRSAKERKPTDILLFDRGIPDSLAYSRLENISLSEESENEIHRYRYNSKVFLFPAWEEIYRLDEERKQDFEEALKTYEVMRETYTRLNYEIVELPRTNLEDRVKFILNHLNL
ncbi:AAA family ATPase [Sinomicrobium sp. M5D2P17]